MIEQLGQPLANGLILGMAYVLIGMGLTITFGLMNVVNFAHGEIYMLGAVLCYTVVSATGANFFVGMAVSVAVVMALAVLFEIGILRRLRRERETAEHTSIFVTIGLSTFLINGVWLVWGAYPRNLQPPFVETSIEFLGVLMTPARIFMGVLTALLIAATHFIVRKTRMGRAMRATFQDKEVAAMVGIDVNRVYTMTFALGSGLAAVAGVLMGSILMVHPLMGTGAIGKAFVVAIVGGNGDLLGTTLAGLALGLLESLGAVYISQTYKEIYGFIMVILVLIFIPQGLAGLFRRWRLLR